MLTTLFFIPLIGALLSIPLIGILNSTPSIGVLSLLFLNNKFLFSIITGFFVTFLFFDVSLLSIIPSSQDGLESFLVPIMIYSNADSDKSSILKATKDFQEFIYGHIKNLPP